MNRAGPGREHGPGRTARRTPRTRHITHTGLPVPDRRPSAGATSPPIPLRRPRTGRRRRADRAFRFSSPQRWPSDAVRWGRPTATMAQRCCWNRIHGPSLRLHGPAEQHRCPIVAVAAPGQAAKCPVCREFGTSAAGIGNRERKQPTTGSPGTALPHLTPAVCRRPPPPPPAATARRPPAAAQCAARRPPPPGGSLIYSAVLRVLLIVASECAR